MPFLFSIMIGLQLVTVIDDGALCQAVLFMDHRSSQASGWKVTPDGNIVISPWDGTDTPGFGFDERADRDRVLMLACLRELSVGRFAFVVTREGEKIAGALAAEQREGSLTVESDLWGTISIPLDRVAAYSFSGDAVDLDVTEVPTVVLKNGDRLPAAIQKIDADTVTISTDFGDTAVSRDTLSAIVLSKDVSTDGSSVDDLFIIELTDGQRIYCDEISGSSDSKLVLERGKARTEITADRLLRAIWPGVRVKDLSRMSFTGECVSYFGQKNQPVLNANARGGMLRIGNTVYSRGLGTKGKSRVTFKTSGEWAYLFGRVGMDPWLGREGDCELAIAVGGEEDWRIRSFRLLSSCKFVERIDGKETIEFRTDFGRRGSMGDFVNWCELLVVGKHKEGDKR